MINKIKSTTKRFTLILFSTFIFSTNIFASAGILPYTKDPNSGEILVLLGFERNKDGWTDFGGRMMFDDKDPAYAAAREGAEESLEIFGAPEKLLRLIKNTPYVVKAQVSGRHNNYTYLYNCYLIQVNYVDTQELIKALAYPEYQNRKFQEKSNFTWIKLKDLFNAIEWAKKHNTCDNVCISNKKLYNKFVEMLKQGLDILRSCILQQIPAATYTSSTSTTSTTAQETAFDFNEFSLPSEEDDYEEFDYMEPTYFGSYEKDLKLIEEKIARANKKKKKYAEFTKLEKD